jgi:hypothetical protein
MRTFSVCVAAIGLTVAACGQGADMTAVDDATTTTVTEAYDGVPGNPDLVRLVALEEPTATLGGAEVLDHEGGRIGAVRSVELAPDGGVEGVVIGLRDGRRLKASPLQARYDAERELVVVSVGLEHLEPAEG